MDSQTQKELLALVKRNYEEIAQEYSAARKKHSDPLRSELVKLCKIIKDGDKVLDVGCGNGRLLEIIGNKKIKYLGVDSSEKLIDIAKNRQLAISNRQFIKGDILELSKIPDINFDYVFSIAVLHHIPGKDLQIAALRQLKNKVAPNGKIIVSVWNLWSQPKYRKLILRTELLKLFNKIKIMSRRFRKAKSRDPELALRASGNWGDILFTGFNIKSKRYYHTFTKRSLRKIIKKAGLKIERLYKDKYNYYAILKK